MDALLALIIFFFSFLSSVFPFGVKFECPDYFHDGENIITCMINRTAIEEAACYSLYQAVTFDRTIKSQPTVAACLSDNYDSGAKCSPLSKHLPGKCWCNDSVGEIFTYKFSYVANRTLDAGGQLECKLCILPRKHLEVVVSEGCMDMKFASHKSNSSHQHLEFSSSTGKHNNTVTIVACVLTVTAVAVLIAVVIIFMKKHRASCRKRDRDICTISKDVGLDEPMIHTEEKTQSDKPNQNGN